MCVEIGTPGLCLYVGMKERAGRDASPLYRPGTWVTDVRRHGLHIGMWSMSWNTCDLMSAREGFVIDWKRGGPPFAEVCRRHGISRKTGYKWLARYEAEGAAAMADRSRRPASSPARTMEEVEKRVVGIRLEHPLLGWAQDREDFGQPRSGRADTRAQHGDRHPAPSRAFGRWHAGWSGGFHAF